MHIDWSKIFAWQQLFNVVDILIVWFLIYQVIKTIKNKRALNILSGVIVFLLVKMLSTLFHLETLDWIMNSIIQWSVLGVIIIFQPEIRNGLEKIGQSLFVSRKHNYANPGEDMIQAIIAACEYMSKRRIGALITIQNEQSLNDIADTGIPLNADITSQLLINIFIPNTPLHDGAVIIQDMHITSAASFLPLSENPNIPKELGTRHRAAVGVSETTDALTVVVSEETGEITITEGGRLHRRLTDQEIHDMLALYYVNEEADEDESIWLKMASTFFTSENTNHREARKGDEDDE
ncbi:MAG: diadenylate cyclase CdaA [Aerococcus sp.]|nr:diadenylate cyclase CdaA [Aerococcus sp.]